MEMVGPKLTIEPVDGGYLITVVLLKNHEGRLVQMVTRLARESMGPVIEIAKEFLAECSSLAQDVPPPIVGATLLPPKDISSRRKP